MSDQTIPVSVPSAATEGWEPNEHLHSPTYRNPIPFFTSAVNGQEIVQALECRMYGLAASEMFLAVHWTLLREARDEIERCRHEAQRAFDHGFRAAGGTITELAHIPNPYAQAIEARSGETRTRLDPEDESAVPTGCAQPSPDLSSRDTNNVG